MKTKDDDHPIEVKPFWKEYKSSRFKKMRGKVVLTKTVWRKLRGR